MTIKHKCVEMSLSYRPWPTEFIVPVLNQLHLLTENFSFQFIRLVTHCFSHGPFEFGVPLQVRDVYIMAWVIQSVSKHQDTVYSNNNICSHVFLQINELFKHMIFRQLKSMQRLIFGLIVLEVKLKWALNYFRLILLPSFIATLSFILSVHKELLIEVNNKRSYNFFWFSVVLVVTV